MSYRRIKKSNKSFIITVLALLIVMGVSSQTDALSGAGSNIANTIFKPIEGVTYSVSSEIMNQIERTVGSKETRAEVMRLEAENRSLVMENARLTSVINKEDFLKNEAEAVDSSKNEYIKANVVNSDVSSLTSNFTIDKGKKDGIKQNDIILQAIGDSKYYTGLVGKVTEVFESTARVETINNQANDVSFINTRSGDYGVIDKFTSRTIQGYMLDVESEAKNSDVVMTSGLGGVYPYGIYIGTISNVSMSQDSLRKNITVDSPVDFSHVYRVLVLKGNNSYEIDEKANGVEEENISE
ncbi:rod shape-determining protein MreC [Anaerococcus sp. mt242]|uniref:rod shape-determining protein MreC n=1 Tax=Anaerococcus sp. mt242 TaxID=2661917 RepID=UPI001933A06E|nr:rod shape-determining protein MreC [Anaerococcus sp. mt242]MBM0045932.1 rod shape-determining protein MreC [Anaerococcus sp. mt242]